jgi:DNA-binding MarR family transcriptional regulator
MSGERPTGRTGPRSIADPIDRVLAGWRRSRPDLDVAPTGVISRLYRLRPLLDLQLEAVFRRHGLSGPGFAVLATLVRLGEPAVSQRRLVRELNLTSGTVSVRVDRLAAAGLVARDPDPRDGRGALVRLTPRGRRAFDACAPEHLANQRQLLASLTDAEQEALAGLLRKLLLCLEGPASDGEHRWDLDLGLTLAPARVAMAMRRSVGLPARPGLLVRRADPKGTGAAAGLREGDLLVSANGRVLRGLGDVSAEDLDPDRPVVLGVVRGVEERQVAVRPAGRLP